MSKWTMFWVGAILSATVSFVTFRGPDLYTRFTLGKYQTFTVAVPDKLFEKGIVSTYDIQELFRTFNRTVVFSMARAIEMKDISSLKKLDIFFGFFDQYDDERYKEWRKKHPKHF